MGQFLTRLAVERRVSASVHPQALSAWLLLHQKVRGVDLPQMDDMARSVLRKRVPVVLTRAVTDIRAVQKLLEHLDVSTTVIYTRVFTVAAGGAAGPLDALVALLVWL